VSPLLLVLCAVPVDARFLLTIDEVPFAELRVRVDQRQYRYEATHFLEEGDARFSRTLKLDAKGRIDGRVPEVLALLSVPASGCREVLEERTNTAEQLCVEAKDGQVVHGRVGEVPFSARYEQGALATIELPGVRWERVAMAAGRPAARASPFADGFAITGGGPRLSLAPALVGAREVVAKATGKGDVTRARCLVLAREAAKADSRLLVVTGLVVEGNRAFPHAWTQRGDAFEDPSRLPGDSGRYLLLPAGTAGRVYLELLDGSRAVTRAGE
jgi:hypothetical protein